MHQAAVTTSTPIPADASATITRPDGSVHTLQTYGECCEALAEALVTPEALVTLPLPRERGTAVPHPTVTLPADLAPLAIVLMPKLAQPNHALLEAILQSISDTLEDPSGATTGKEVYHLDKTLAAFASEARKARRDGKAPPRLEDLTAKGLFHALRSTALLAQTVCDASAASHMHFLAKLIAAESAIDWRGYELATMCGPLSPAEHVLMVWINLARGLFIDALAQPEGWPTKWHYLPVATPRDARRELLMLDAALKTILPAGWRVPSKVETQVTLNEKMDAMLAFAQYR